MLNSSLKRRKPLQGFDQRKRGFTLVEIMIVIALMAAMMAIMVVVIGNASSNARTKATRATILKLSKLINHKMQAFERQVEALNEEAGNLLPEYVTDETATLGTGVFDEANVPVALPDLEAADEDEIIIYFAKKDLQRIYFPQTFDDLQVSDSHPFEPTTLLAATGGHDVETESSELMYFLLTEMQGFGMEPGDLDQFTSNEIQDTDGDGLPEFVDGWGHPLRFYRWPTRLIRPATTSATLGTPDQNAILTDASLRNLYFGALPADLTADPDDEFSILRTEQVTSITSPDDIGALFEDFDFSNLPTELETDLPLPTLNTYSVPLIVSAGEDGQLGLFEPTDTANFGYLAQPVLNDAGSDVNLEPSFDNISSQNLRQGGN